MATIEMTGLDEYMAKLRTLGEDGKKVCRASVFEGGNVLANAIRAKIESMSTIEPTDAVIAWKQERPIGGITEKQKEGLLDGLYLRKMGEDNGFIYTQIGFSGYNDVKTAKYPSGQPNALIARSIESGSSARPKKPFVRPTANSVKSEATAAMESKFYEMVGNIMN